MVNTFKLAVRLNFFAGLLRVDLFDREVFQVLLVDLKHAFSLTKVELTSSVE